MKRHVDVPFSAQRVFHVLTDARAFHGVVPTAASCSILNPEDRTRARVTIHLRDGTTVQGTATHWLPPRLFILTLHDGRRTIWSLEPQGEAVTRVSVDTDASEEEVREALDALRDALSSEAAAPPVAGAYPFGTSYTEHDSKGFSVTGKTAETTIGPLCGLERERPE